MILGSTLTNFSPCVELYFWGYYRYYQPNYRPFLLEQRHMDEREERSMLTRKQN